MFKKGSVFTRGLSAQCNGYLVNRVTSVPARLQIMIFSVMTHPRGLIVLMGKVYDRRQFG